MCGRYGLYNDPSALVKRLRARIGPNADFAPRYNIAPTTPVLAIVNAPERTLRSMRWGLVPRFAERKPVRRSTFNARIETLATSPMYGPLLPGNRCIVLADGYYEWPRSPAGETAPIWIARADGATIAMAGVWDGDAVTVITQPSNEAIARLHDRMPVTLEPAVADEWLAGEALAPEAALALLRPSEAHIWVYRRVARTVGNARAEGPELIEALSERTERGRQISLFS